MRTHNFKEGQKVVVKVDPYTIYGLRNYGCSCKPGGVYTIETCNENLQPLTVCLKDENWVKAEYIFPYHEPLTNLKEVFNEIYPEDVQAPA